MQVKIITYNIWHGHFLDKVIDFLNSEKADIILLQENGQRGQALGSAKINLFKTIGEGIGYKGIYLPLWGQKNPQADFQLGVSIYSRFPMVELARVPYGGEYREFYDYLSYRFNWPTAVLIAKVRLGERNLTVATTHLIATKETAVTSRQLRAARALSKTLVGYPEIIFGGDMNTLPGSATYQVISEGMTDLTDHTKPTLHPTIHPVGNLGYHVDYLYVKGIQVKSYKTQIPTIDASDHLPIVSRIEI